MGVVHSGFDPGCHDAGRERTTVGFTEEWVNCPDCLEVWRVHGMPKFIVRRGETPAEFRRRTRPRDDLRCQGCDRVLGPGDSYIILPGSPSGDLVQCYECREGS
jgi:hypothetical protein